MRTSRTLIFLLGAGASALAQVPAPPAVVPPPASPVVAAPAAERPAVLELKLDRTSARSGEKLSLVVEVVNRSGQTLKIKTRQIFLHLRMDIRQPDGTCCRYNPYRHLRVTPVENFEWQTLAPGAHLELATFSPVVGEVFDFRGWETYKVRGHPVDWFERFPLGPDGRLLGEEDIPKPFTLKGLHSIHASYTCLSREADVVTAAESPIVDFTVAP